MTKKLNPIWTPQEEESGQQLHKAWETFFSADENSSETTEEPISRLAENQRLSEVRARHESNLLGLPNVVGVAEGIRTKLGRPTGESCLTVYVERKVPRVKLAKKDILPTKIEGIPIDVVEVGKVEPLAT